MKKITCVVLENHKTTDKTHHGLSLFIPNYTSNTKSTLRLKKHEGYINYLKRNFEILNRFNAIISKFVLE